MYLWQVLSYDALWLKIFPWIRKFAIFDLVYILACTNAYQSASNFNYIFCILYIQNYIWKIYMTLRSWMNSIMGLIGLKQHELFALQLDLVYTLACTCIYDANLKIFMFEPKRLRALKLCMNHYLVDVARPAGSVMSVLDSWHGGCEFDPWLRRLFFLVYFCLSPLQKHVRKVVGGLGKKSCVSIGVRKPGNTYVSPTAMIWP